MAELIPRRVLFGNPERISPRISPDASTLAWIAPHDGVLNVWTAPVGPDGADWAAARVVTDDTDRGIRMFAWAHDGRHLLYLQDTGGDENWRLHDVDLATMQRRDLTPFDKVQTQLIAAEKKFPTEILIGLNRENPQLHDVFRLDLTTGELTKEVENPGFVGWVADSQLVVRAGVAPQPDGGLVLMVRGGDGDEWRSLLSIDAEDALTSGPVAFSEDGTSMLVMSSVGTNTGRLVRLNLATGDAEVLAEDPEADVTGIRLHPDTREPQIVTFLKDRSEYRVLDPDVADDLAANRGYLCIQVNYRGATGYGKAFVNAGDREWGGRMHDDLVDAIAHITGQGWADPARIAIYGGSYGGYAALVWAAFTPALFRCAVDIVGPSNLKT